MKITRRMIASPADIQMMIKLSQDFPADHLHVYDLPYRFASWALDDPANSSLWLDEHDKLLAWAVMQAPFWTVDYACRPDAEKQLHPEILAWADMRAQELSLTSMGRPAWYIMVFSDQYERSADLGQAGFADQSDVGEDSWSKVWMTRPNIPPDSYSLPLEDIEIRFLLGEAEVEAYVGLHRTVFESKNMTIEWRLRTLQAPEYHPDLDLVAVAPDGCLAAFCIGWLGKDKTDVYGQVEPLGVHPDFRKTGLGRAMLYAVLQRFRERGAKKVFVETDIYRNAALALYESAGFRVIRDVKVYRKDYDHK